MKKLNRKQQTEYDKLVTLLENEDWLVERRSELDCLIEIRKNDELYLLSLFFGDESGDNAWLTDEENFNDDEPLWFSESSHCISPISLLNKLQSTEVSPFRTMLVLMGNTQFINADDEYQHWAPTRAVSLRMLKLLIVTEKIDFFFHSSYDVEIALQHTISDDAESKEDDSDEDEETKSLTTSEDEEIDVESFMKELDEKFQRSLERRSSTTPQSEFSARIIHRTESFEDDADSQDAVEDPERKDFPVIKNVRFAMENTTGINQVKEPTLCNHFRATEQEGHLLIKLELDASTQYAGEIHCTLRGFFSHTVGGFILEQGSYDQCSRLSFERLPAGTYYLTVGTKQSPLLYSFPVMVLDVSESFSEHFKLEGFGLFRLNSGEEMDHGMLAERGSFSCFALKNLAAVVSAVCYRNSSSESVPYQFITLIYNESDECVYESEISALCGGGEVMEYINEIGDPIKERGSYQLRVIFFNEIILKAKFVIANEDISYIYKPQSIEMGRSKTNGLIYESSNAMEQLQSMIGLSRLKRDISSLIAKVKLDELRLEHKLPTQNMPLHLAFLGNPGTGKTTVAKILGQIYKEIGLLTKGHVVVEERATLTGQNWNAECDLTRTAIEASQEGILFIDEAYDLVTEHPNDPGKQVISTLLSKMSDEKCRNWMVIFAGYTKKMERFLSTNPGLRSRTTTIYFDDYNTQELIQIADHWLEKNSYRLTSEARNLLEMNIASAYANREEHFGNARYVSNLLENEILPAMAERVTELEEAPSVELLSTIEELDIPNYNEEQGAEEAISMLDNMIGLTNLKSEIRSHLDYIRFLNARRKHGIRTPLPPMHMIFTGNPGTGKTSLADYLGKIYKSMGILRTGNVVKITRADVIDKFVGGTEDKMKNILTAAHGNILFIDEAYTFMKTEGSNDVGHRAIELLLDILGKESTDMIVIMAGYAKEMEELLNMNPGLKARFPYTFNFPDYEVEELYNIAMSEAVRNGLRFTPPAREALRAIIKREHQSKDANFGNARFAVRLITTQIMPRMARRLLGVSDPKKLCRIRKEDLPISAEEVERINAKLFDEPLLAQALKELDGMVGLVNVKKAIHQFVNFAREQHKRDEPIIDSSPLKWRFMGNYGTGKSSVAKILAKILKALNLIKKDEVITITPEEIITVAQSYSQKSINKKIHDAQHQLLFVNGVTQELPESELSINSDALHLFSSTIEREKKGHGVLIVAEKCTSCAELVKSLDAIGIYNFDSTLIFEDYSPEELLDILDLCLGKLKLTLDDMAKNIMIRYIKRVITEQRGTYANSRTIKLLSYTIQKICIANQLSTGVITAELVTQLANSPLPKNKRMGF